MSDIRLSIFCVLMALIWSPIIILIKLYDLLAYPFIRYRRMKQSEKRNKEDTNRLLFGDDYKKTMEL